MRFDPVIVRVRSGLPADALVGEIEVMATGPNEGVGEGGAEYPSPQPDPAKTRAMISDMPVIRSIGLLLYLDMRESGGKPAKS